ncbi:putative disease resistance protein [Hibiscus syriacus]|uniref:Disease resistance protein n=2 Tax=Hibiscus syriacus TaxID=106335 RepID=A0A6A3AJ84_HIBSY|nr:putative disease resistance protein [Hibiscus syriacus]
MDMKSKQLTVTGTVDPVNVVSKLRKYWPTVIVSVGPAKEPEKKEEPKKEEAKKEEGEKKEGEKKEGEKKEGGEKEGGEKEEGKKEEGKKEEEKKEEEKKAQPPPDPVLELVKAYRAYNPHMTSYYYVQSMEENPNA